MHMSLRSTGLSAFKIERPMGQIEIQIGLMRSLGCSLLPGFFFEFRLDCLCDFCVQAWTMLITTSTLALMWVSECPLRELSFSRQSVQAANQQTHQFYVKPPTPPCVIILGDPSGLMSESRWFPKTPSHHSYLFNKEHPTMVHNT